MNIDKKTIKHIFFAAAGCILLYWILHETERFRSVFTFLKEVLSPFILGAGMAFIINVPMRSIENKFVCIRKQGLRRAIALLLTLLIFALVLALVFFLLIPQVIETATVFYDSLLKFFAKAQAEVVAFLNDNPQVLEWIRDTVGAENFSLEALNISALVEKVANMLGNSFSTIFKGAVSAIGDIAGVLVNVVLGVVFAIYGLFNKETLARQGRKLVYAFLPEKLSDNIIRVLRLTNTTFSHFLSGQCLEVCILGAMFAVSMAIFRMPYIPLVSVLVAVTAFIPVVGAFVGCFFGAFFILVNDPLQAVGFVVLFLVVQQIEGNLIYPRVVGDSIGLPGMWVLLAVAVGGELMGVAGMFLMIPLASVLYTLLREVTNNRLQHRDLSEEKLIPQAPDEQEQFKNKLSLKCLKSLMKRKHK